jgi:hypothetical protein
MLKAMAARITKRRLARLARASEKALDARMLADIGLNRNYDIGA